MIRPISFGAILRQNVQINKYFSKVPAGIVEIDFDSKEDKYAVKKAVDTWHGNKYGNTIYDKLSYGYTPKAEAEDWHVYALTTQEDGYDHLDSSKILGLELVSGTEDGLYLNYLQVKPSTNHSSFFRKYSQIGRSLVEYLKKITDKICLDADGKAVGFYEKLDFITIEKEPHGKVMEWTSEGYQKKDTLFDGQMFF